MSDVIDDDDTDALAAEYVLGTLDADERTHANLLLDIDDAFRAKVRLWERRLGELHLMVEPVEPAPHILERIKAKMESAALSTAAVAKPASAELTSAAPANTKPDPEPTPESEPASALATAASSSRVEQKPPDEEAVKEAIPEPDTSPDASVTPQETTLDALEAELRKAGLADTASEASARSPTLFPEHRSEMVITGPDQADERPADPILRERRDAPAQPMSYSASKETDALRPALRRWRAAAVLLLLIVLAFGALIAAWRYAPERLPSGLSVHSLLNVPLPPPPPPPKPKAPPESVFEE
jgi:hypothetical protein